jgi:DNA polymerase-3 subunit gamma/tau
MAYLSLYRKYRSQSFEELFGQEHVTRTLQNAIRSNRVAHAYLFCGPRGTGKTSSARLLAKALNCESGPAPEPCNRCSACTQITEGRFMDVIEIDAASNRGIDDIRGLRETVAYAPTSGRYKVYVIDEAHQITNEGFNALLKTLEEPPEYVIFVLATTDAHKLPNTIASRCQRFEFRRGSLSQLKERIAFVARSEGAEVEDAALELLARGANGGWRDALSLLEQVLAYAESTVTARDVYAVQGSVEEEFLSSLVEQLAAGDGAGALAQIDALIGEGKDPRQILHDVTGYFRGLMLAAAGSPPAGDPAAVARCNKQARLFGRDRLVRAIESLAQTEREARWSEEPRLLLELALVRLLPKERAATRPEDAPAVPAALPEAEALQPIPVSARPSAPSMPEAADRPPAPLTPSLPASAAEPRRSVPAAAVAPTVALPQPLTLGDARIGGRDDEDDFDALFDLPPPPDHEIPPLEPAAEGPPARSANPEPQRIPAPAPVKASPPPAAPRTASPLASSSAVTVPGPPALGAEELAAIRGKWRIIQEELRREKQVMLATCLDKSEPDRFEGVALVIRFPSDTMARLFTDRGKAFSDRLTEVVSRLTRVSCQVRAESPPRGGGATAGGTARQAPTRLAGRPAPARSGASTPSTGPARGAEATAPASRLDLEEQASPASGPPDRRATASGRAPAAPVDAPGGAELVHNVLELFEGQVLDERD